ncbi:zinc-binding protein A33-like [Discoglossus pictus]
MATGNISSDLNCILCQKISTEPELLHCGHNFCPDCLKKEWASMDGNDEEKCPTYEQECTSGAYSRNLALANSVRLCQATAFLEEEQEKDGQGPLCKEHNEELSVFCTEDSKLCCLVCRDSLQHAQHNFLPLQEAFTCIKMPLNLQKIAMKVTLAQLCMKAKKQKVLITEHMVNKLHLNNHIAGEFTKLHQFLNSRERELLEEMEREAEMILKEMEDNLEDLTHKCTELQLNLAQCEERLREKDHIKMLQDIKEFIQRYCNEQEITSKAVATVVKKTLSSGKFKGPLQYQAWKAMLSVIKPVTASLTLDAETAHPDLVFSDNFTSLHKKHSSSLKSSQSPNRFGHFPVALASVGFSAGRHYWEVDVSQVKEWYIGFAKETMVRKQQTDVSTRDGYWAIYLYNNHVHILDDLPKRKLGVCKPERVGVYLDYEQGQVSFYNANEITHIFSFKDTFTEKVFPYISPGFTEESPIKMVHLHL